MPLKTLWKIILFCVFDLSGKIFYYDSHKNSGAHFENVESTNKWFVS